MVVFSWDCALQQLVPIAEMAMALSLRLGIRGMMVHATD